MYLCASWITGFLIWDLEVQKFNAEAVFFIFIIVPITIAIYFVFSVTLLTLFGIQKLLTKDQDRPMLRL
jgi:hypothetical protein